MSNTKLILLVVGISLLFLLGGAVLVSTAPSTPKVTRSEQAKVELAEISHDWGTISINGGKVEKTFTIRSAGSDPLQLADVKTSCMCTEAQIVIDGQQSPFFGMHSSSSWIGQVSPGKEARILVVFDPAFHGPSGVGQITRIVSLKTNDPQHLTLEFTLTANVVNEEG